jgi:hypothetical protein
MILLFKLSQGVIYNVKKFFSDSIFEFSGISCKCEVGNTFTESGDAKYEFYLYPKEEIIYYAYKAGIGLISNKSKNFDGSKEVLPDLLAIKPDEPMPVKKFFETHGYILPLEQNKHTNIRAELLFGLINRLKATVSLMASIVEVDADYEKLLSLTLFLLLEPQIQTNYGEHGKFESWLSEINSCWHNINNIPERIINHETENYDLSQGCLIADSIRPPSTLLGTDEYTDILLDMEDGFQRPKEKVVYLFRNAADVSANCRLAINFLFHFFKDIGYIQAWDCKGELLYKANNPAAAEQFHKPDSTSNYKRV